MTVLSPGRLVRPGTATGDDVRIPALVTLPVVRLPVLRNTARLRRRLHAMFTDRAVQVVHLHSELGMAEAAIEVGRDLGLPVVHTVDPFFWQTEAHVQTLLGLAVPRLHRWVTGLPTPGGVADRGGDCALRNMTLAVGRAGGRVISPSAHQGRRLQTAGVTKVDVISNTLTDDLQGPGVPALGSDEGVLAEVLVAAAGDPGALVAAYQAAVAARAEFEPATRRVLHSHGRARDALRPPA